MLDARAVILIPTFNESTSIVELLRSLGEIHIAQNFEAIILDDNSPDKTADIVDSLALSWVRVIRRPGKAGLGAAYRSGFKDVLQMSEYKFIVTMDADGSHRVEDLPAMLSAARNQADDSKVIVLGTRWMPGGSVVNWPRSRQLLSKSGTRYARLALRIPLNDLTGGFRVYSRNLLFSLKLDQMFATGYCFQIEMTKRMSQIDGRILEVPITFIERQYGVSKMSKKIVFEAIYRVTTWGLSAKFRRKRP